MFLFPHGKISPSCKLQKTYQSQDHFQIVKKVHFFDQKTTIRNNCIWNIDLLFHVSLFIVADF